MPRVTQQNPKGLEALNSDTSAGDAWGFADNLHMVIYGDSGTGKTTFWASFPGPILALICSGRGKPGELRSINTPANQKKIKAKTITRFEQINEELGYAEGGHYKTFVMDHLLGMQDLNLKDLMGYDKIPTVKNWGDIPGEVYKQSNRQMIETLRRMLDLPCNVVIVSQERVYTGKDEGIPADILAPKTGPSANPGVVTWLKPTVDYAVQAFVRPKMVTTEVPTEGGEPISVTEPGKGVEFCIRTEKHPVFWTKLRRVHNPNKPLPDVIVDPTYAKLKDVIDGK